MWWINYFHIQILMIELLFCIRLQRRKGFWARFLVTVPLYCALPMLIRGGFFAPIFMVDWFTFGFLFMFVLSGALIAFCFRMHIRQVIFYCCVAHTLQHMVHCLSRLTGHLFQLPPAVSQMLHLGYMICACLIVTFLLRDRFRSSETVDIQNGYLLTFAALSTLIIYVVSFWGTSMETETISLLLFDFFCCTLLLIIQLDIFRIREVRREQLMMERLLRQEQEQHELSRATIEVINRKCHDLRHQIAALRHMSDDEKFRSIAELESAVLIYDHFPKSGNEDVDLILAEKNLLAEQKQIAIRSMVDGNGLAFMKVEDLYSLLGNALDNAIEATAQEENASRRIVTLIASEKGGCYSIHLENPCPTEPVFMDNLPVTTKPDKDYHGYGMRSMRYLCAKYNGVMTAGWEDGIFSLDILFPAAKAA